jgi:homoserine kinase type II
MSVFTSVSVSQLGDWLKDYAIGEVVEIKGISAGITNTNYFVTTQLADNAPVKSAQAKVGLNRYVLTLFEHNTLEELPYFIDLMSHLATNHIPCPTPIMDKQGNSLHLLNGKPATLVSCLSGRDVEAPTAQHCAEVGRVLAQMHIAGLSFDLQPHHHTNQNPRGAAWRKSTAQLVLPHLNLADQALLNETLLFQENFNVAHLPAGVIHADLFRDNVLFDGDKVGGLIDFYYACHDVLAYDLAIAVNDWCVDANGALNVARLTAMLAAYQQVRPLNQDELHAWPSLLRIAALRFWLSRLYDQIFPQAGELTHAKDPEHFKRILKLRGQS